MGTEASVFESKKFSGLITTLRFGDERFAEILQGNQGWIWTRLYIIFCFFLSFFPLSFFPLSFFFLSSFFLLFPPLQSSPCIGKSVTGFFGHVGGIGTDRKSFDVDIYSTLNAQERAGLKQWPKQPTNRRLRLQMQVDELVAGQESQEDGREGALEREKTRSLRLCAFLCHENQPRFNHILSYPGHPKLILYPFGL